MRVPSINDTPLNASVKPVRSDALQSSLRLEPVVVQENCGYWVKAIARVTPSSFIFGVRDHSVDLHSGMQCKTYGCGFPVTGHPSAFKRFSLSFSPVLDGRATTDGLVDF